MTCLLVTSDLTVQSAVAGAVAACLGKLLTVDDVQQAIKLAGDVSPQLVLLDLAPLDLNDLSLVPAIRQKWPQATILAYGPHVHAAKLEAARQAGCDEVLTRGQFHHQMHEIAARYLRS